MAISDKYIRKLSTTRAKKLLTSARSVIAKDLGRSTVFTNLQVMSTIKGRNAGKIIGKMYDIPKKIEKQVAPITEKYAWKIFNYSQELVPIDKRYIGKISADDPNRVEIQRSIYTYDIPVVDYESIKNSKKKKSIEKFHQSIPYESTTPFKPSGVYGGEQGSFIKEFFRNPNKRAWKQLYVDPITGKFTASKIRYGIDDRSYRLSVFDFNPERQGGNQELKRSGRVEEWGAYGFRILYNPMDAGANWNYAQLQHDNLRYKHKSGQALYLYTAFEKFRQDYYNDVKKMVQKVIKEANK